MSHKNCQRPEVIFINNKFKRTRIYSPSGVLTVPALLIFEFHLAGVVGAGLRSGVGG